MNTLRDEVAIEGTASDVYRALTSQEGYNGWWSKDCEIDGGVGGVSTLHFDKAGTRVTMRFRADDLEEDRRVRWTCIENDATVWVGTNLDWRIQPGEGAVRVSLEHGGWKDPAPAEVGQGWKHFLGSLKSYVETGAGQPW